MLVRLFALAILAVIPAMAATPSAAQQQSSTASDANEKICESISVIGSRLAKKRVCATRAEWEEQRRQDRQAMEQIQKQIGGPCSVVANKNTGAPSC
jgi:hypothetical protein